MGRASTDTTRGQIVRFGLLGGVNTAVTAAAFYLLSFAMSAQAAFTLVYAAGLVFVILTTPKFVFGADAGWLRRLALGCWYLAVYVVGLGVVWLLDDWLDAPRLVVVLGTVLVTAPLTFVGAQALMRRRT